MAKISLTLDNIAKQISNSIIKESTQRKRNYIVTVDFDGTVVTHEYPRVGHDIGAVPVLKKIVESGGLIILDTMRGTQTLHGDTLTPAINWFKKNGIPLYAVQSNPTQSSWTNSSKIHAQLCIDDRNAGAPLINGHIDWKKIQKYLENQGLIEPDYDDESDDILLLQDLDDKIDEWIDMVYTCAPYNETLMDLTTKLKDLTSNIKQL